MTHVIFGYLLPYKNIKDAFNNIRVDNSVESPIVSEKDEEVLLKDGYSLFRVNAGNTFLVLQREYFNRDIETSKIKQPHYNEVTQFFIWANKYINNLRRDDYSLWIINDREDSKKYIKIQPESNNINEKEASQVAIGDIVLIKDVKCEVIQKRQAKTGKHGSEKISLQCATVDTKTLVEVILKPKETIRVHSNDESLIKKLAVDLKLDDIINIGEKKCKVTNKTINDSNGFDRVTIEYVDIITNEQGKTYYNSNFIINTTPK